MTTELAYLPSRFRTRNDSSAQERVQPFEEIPNDRVEVLEARLAFRTRQHRNLFDNASTFLSQYTEIFDLANELITNVQSQSNDDFLYDSWLASMPKSVEEAKANFKFVGKGQPKFHFDFEVD